jgi:hypothetical protein
LGVLGFVGAVQVAYNLDMRKIFLVFLVLLLAFFSLGLGVAIRLIQEKGKNPRDLSISFLKNNTNEIKTDAKLCLPELNISSGLSLDRYEAEKIEKNLILIKRDGNESFFIVPSSGEENFREKYNIPDEPDFFVASLNAGVNEIIEKNQTSYFVDPIGSNLPEDPPEEKSTTVASDGVDYISPFFVVFLPNTPNDIEAHRDIDQFLKTAEASMCNY